MIANPNGDGIFPNPKYHESYYVNKNWIHIMRGVTCQSEKDRYYD
jgi:hypothetical protein